MAYLEIKVREGTQTKIKIGMNVPNTIIDLWEEGNEEDANFEINYQITKYFENKYRKLRKRDANSTCL